ncbi:MAG: MFS transporter [Candidatus Odinarchaeota archaeon]
MIKSKWTVLGITTVGVFMSSLDSSIVNIAIPSISLDLGSSFEIIQWIPIIYLLTMAITLISFGRLSDLKGRKNFYLLGVFLFTISSFLSTLANSGELLVVFRAIQGTGSSFMSANAAAMITDIFPRQETGKALGINVASIYLGLVIGPVLGGFLVQYFSWRSIFIINIPIGIVLIIIGIFKLEKVNTGLNEERFDIKGTIIFGIFLASLLLGLTIANNLGWLSFIIITLFGVSIFSFILFIFIESKTNFPLFKLSLFKTNRLFSFANFAALLNYIAISGVSFLLSIYLQIILEIPPAITALLLMPTSLVMALTSPFSGKLSDKYGTRILCTVGMSIMAFGFTLLILVIEFLPLIFIIVTQFFIGIGIGFFSSPNQSAIMNSVEKRDHGIASGTLSTMRVVGQSISVALLSAILTLFMPVTILNSILSHKEIIIDPLIKVEFINGMQAVLTISIIICLIGALFSFLRGKSVSIL